MVRKFVKLRITFSRTLSKNTIVKLLFSSMPYKVGKITKKNSDLNLKKKFTMTDLVAVKRNTLGALCLTNKMKI